MLRLLIAMICRAPRTKCEAKGVPVYFYSDEPPQDPGMFIIVLVAKVFRPLCHNCDSSAKLYSDHAGLHVPSIRLLGSKDLATSINITHLFIQRLLRRPQRDVKLDLLPHNLPLQCIRLRKQILHRIKNFKL